MNEWIGRLKNTLNPGVLIMLAAGVMLLIMSCQIESTPKGSNSTNITGYRDDREDSILEPTNETELVSYYENKLQKLLSEVEGIGEVRVMLSPELNGACILCEGAGNATVKSEIIEICKSLFDIPAHKVQIFQIKKENSYEGQ